MLFGFRTIQKKNILTINTIIEIQQILEDNNAGMDDEKFAMELGK